MHSMPAADCKVCGAELELYEWLSLTACDCRRWGMHGKYGTQVEGPGAEKLQVTHREPRRKMGWQRHLRRFGGRGR